MKEQTNVRLRGAIADEYYEILQRSGQEAADNFVRRIYLIKDPKISKVVEGEFLVISRVLDS